MKSANLHVDCHQRLQATNLSCSMKIDAITTATIRANHYKNARVQQLKQVATNRGGINKRDNERQQKSGVDWTLPELGFIPHGKVTKATHHVALTKEIVHRGLCTAEEAKLINFRDQKKQLKAHEIIRLRNSVNEAMATKGFQPQCEEALFPAK
jgi:hypothetical protein